MCQSPCGNACFLFLKSNIGLRRFRRIPHLLSAVLLFVLSWPSIAAQTPNMITHVVDTDQARVLTNYRPSWASAANHVGTVPAGEQFNQLTLVLSRSPQQEQAFEELLVNQQNPASPDYHHWLTPGEVGTRFGLSDSDIATLTGWLQSQGLHVNWVSPSRIFIGFGGSVADVNRAFKTELHYYKVNGEQRVSVSSDPMIPEAFVPAIKAVHGLYTVESHPMHHIGRLQSGSPEFTNSNSGAHALAPADFATIYDLPASLTGAGQTIGVVGRARVSTADLNNFKSLTGSTFTNPTVIIPTVFGGVDPGPAYTAPTTGDDGDQVEATLDVTRAGSVAPGAQLLLVASATTQTTDGIEPPAEYLVNTTPVPAQVMTFSFGLCESLAGSAEVTFWDTLFKQAASEGISVFVSSGDHDASGCDSATPPSKPLSNSPNNLCSSSYSTCVGGTEFNDVSTPSTYWNSSNGAGLSSARSYIPEGAWNEPGTNSEPQVWGSGGGVSKFIPTPSWQTGNGVPAARAGRYTPDISFSASGHDAYFVCLATEGASCAAVGGNYSYITIGGTSASAPDMAGVAALLNQKLGAAQGNLNPQLYQLASSTPTVFHDVSVASSGVTNCSVNTPSMCNNSAPGPTGLSGGQAGYLVTAGYDEVTGLGSLDVANFVSAWINSATATPVFSPGGGTYTSKQSVTISDATSGATIYYTIDGTTPTTNSAQYTAAISVSTTETIKAIATSPDALTSAVASATYTFNPAATPVFAPAAGTYATAQAVTISDSTAGATIYYTTDGTTPTSSSTVYAGPITVSTSETIKAIASVNGLMTSSVATASYIIHPAETPTFSLAPGLYSTIQTVSISDSTPGATIYYTIDGTTPTSSSTKYTAPITVASTVTLKAIATAPGYSSSLVATATYTVKLMAATPTFSVAPGTYTVGFGVTITDATAGVNIYYTTDGTTPTINSPIYIAPIVVSAPETIKAFASSSNDTDSVVATAAYVVATGSWTWMGGSSTGNQHGVYGSIGVAAAGYVPGGRESASSITTKDGNFWLMGGYGYDSSTYTGDLSDLWQFNPSTNDWAWTAGKSTEDTLGVYGTLGVAAYGNVPGSRQWAASWTDKDGNLWFFGGLGDGAGNDGLGGSGVEGDFSDLWEYNSSTGRWTWMAGSNLLNQGGVYGTLGVAAAGNSPGSRESASSWTDSSGNLWLFGGLESNSHGSTAEFNDLWKFDISAKQWAWMGGSNTLNQPGTYGTLGVAAVGNIPGGRSNSSSWTDKSGNFWIFGGMGIDSTGSNVYLNDLWEFSPSTQQWTWISGSSTGEKAGVHNNLGIAAAGNSPGSRITAINWTDHDGELWLFGGFGRDSTGATSYLGDLWKFDPSIQKWAWMGGSSIGAQAAVYGTLDVADTGNNPGNRESASSWTDNNGNLWLFGGHRYDSPGKISYLNDLWKFTPAAAALPTAATPDFSVDAGTYATAQTVTISDAVVGATIYYTTDGTTPTTNSPVYSSPITVSSTETIKAIATANGYLTSSVASVTYTINPSAATPDFSLAAGTYIAAQTVTISDATAGAIIYYTTDCSTPTTNSTVYSGPITVSSTETIKAIATASGYSTSLVASAIYTISLPVAASPAFSPAGGTYTSAQTVTISDATTGATIYYTTDGSTPTSSSTVYSGPIAVSSTETIEALATATGYSPSAVATATYTINIPPGAPVISSMSPAYTNAGGAGFTLTVNGSGFSSQSTVAWGSTALSTQYVSAAQLKAQVPASNIASAGTASITVQTPGAGTSNTMSFEVDTASSGTTPPTFSSLTATVTAGATAAYPVTLSTTASSISATCLNLPAGATCSYSASTSAITIATSSTTPKGTYQVTVVFTETVSGAAAAGVVLPMFLLPLWFIRTQRRGLRVWLTICVGMVLTVAAFTIGCGGGGGSSTTTPPTNPTHQVTTSGAVTLTVQ